LDAEIQRLAARVEELEQEKTQFEDFVAMAAHELLRPLMMTEAFADLILGRGADPETQDDLRRLMRGTARVRVLVESLLLDASQRGQPLERRPVDTHSLVEECLSMLKLEIAARDARVEVSTLPVVQGDPDLLSGVFTNLLINALRYGPRLGGSIRVSAVRREAGWLFEVDSAGAAIPEAERERIFDAWQRGREERRVRGSGLGLAIVRRIVERHGGEVGVTSPEGTGNRFFFTLPA
jgi:signal transduction histidine kinase